MELKNIENIDALKDLMFSGKEKDGFYGDGKEIVVFHHQDL